MTDTPPPLVLASQSPRRQELLRQIGVPFSTLPVAVDESVLPGELPEAYVERLALAKASAGYAQASPGALVLGSDTTVVSGGHILGKPGDEAEAVAMLQGLSGRCHRVMTAIALVSADRVASRVVSTDVYFRPISIEQCRRYWQTGEPRDKAGAYGIQGYGAIFVDHIEGSYSAVVGLPLAETADLLDQLGIECWQTE